MANTSNLRGYLKDVANSIRNVTGSNANILANEYDLIINNFILANETSLNITPMVNAQHFGPAAGYSGYNSIDIAAVDNTLEPNMTPENIANGVNIFGVIGNVTAGEDLNNELNNQSNTIANLQNEVNILSDALNNAYIGINNVNLSNMNYSETSNFVRSSDGSNYSFGIVNIPFNGLSYNGGSLRPTTNFNNMYYNVYGGVKTLTSFDTSNVTNMSYMFSGFYSLTNVPNFNTSNVINMQGMFYACHNLINVPNFDTSNVDTIGYMFANCRTLASVPNFNTSNVKYFGRMFENCANLVDVPTFASNNLYDMSYIFMYCNNLSNKSILNIVNMCINAVNYGRDKNLSNTFQSSPLYGTKFDNSYYTELWDALNNAGWTY